MSEEQDYTVHTTEEAKKYRLMDGDVRVEILKGANQETAAQGLHQLAEEIKNTPASPWERWDQGASKR